MTVNLSGPDCFTWSGKKSSHYGQHNILCDSALSQSVNRHSDRRGLDRIKLTDLFSLPGLLLDKRAKPEAFKQY